MKKKKTILLFSHGITGKTGFAKMIHKIGMGLDKAGHKVYAIHPHYHGTPITPKELGGVTILPIGTQQWGEDILPIYIDMYKPDIVLTLLDIWCAHYISQIPKKHNWHWIRHITLDTENIVDFWAKYIAETEIPITYSKFAGEMVDRLKLPYHYIPAGVDTKLFKPSTHKERAKLREHLGLRNDEFVVLCVAHNQFRKNIDRLLEAFAIFSRNKGNTKLVLHMLPRDNIGWDIPKLIKQYGIEGRVLFTNMNKKNYSDVFVTEEMMRDLYCAADVHMLLTGGEGFGLPITESMSCGIPNICTAWTTPKEFLGEVEEGILKSVRGWLIPIVAVTKHHTGGDWAIADIRKAAEALEDAYQHPEKVNKMGMLSRKFIEENYDWDDVVIPKWVDIIENTEKYLKKHDDTKVKLALMDVRE
jgi:glycosyltransferase involved in cell wall biosynthesis